jgi:hypothetical protein
MTARVAAASVSVVLAVASAGCLSYYEVPVETPIRARLDVTPFQRVLVAGFVAGGSRALDANAETARLLRSQLRSRSEMKLIDADVIGLVDEVDKRRAAAAPDAAAATAGAGAPGDPQIPQIKDERDLQQYEAILKDETFWKKVGEEYGAPLIITGSVLFTEVSRSGMVSRVRPFTDQLGRQQVEERREFASLKGFALAPKFVFIDGRTGAQLHTETFYEEALYSDSTNTPALSSYFEMMDKLMPAVLNTLSTQKIRGTRILLIK